MGWKDQEVYGRLCLALINNPLVRFDRSVVEVLLGQLREGQGGGLLVKLLITRDRYGLIEEYVASKEVLARVSEYYLNQL